MAGRGGEIPVYAGCAEPLEQEWVGAEYVHGQDGMGDSFFPQATQRPEPDHAVDELIRRVDESPGPSEAAGPRQPRRNASHARSVSRSGLRVMLTAAQ